MELIPQITLNHHGREITGEVVKYYNQNSKCYVVIEEPGGARHEIEVDSFSVFMEQLEIPFS